MNSYNTLKVLSYERNNYLLLTNQEKIIVMTAEQMNPIQVESLIMKMGGIVCRD